MNRFTPLLKKINTKLDLPQPAKSRIVLEIAADLEDLFQFYRNQGLDEKAAMKKVYEKFDVTDEALMELAQIHESVFRKWMDKISERAQNRWEHFVMILILISIALLASKAILSTRFFVNISMFVLPMVGIAFFVMAKFLEKAYYLYIKKDYDIKTLRKGLLPLLVLGSGNIFLGISGYFIELLMTGENAVFTGLLGILCLNPKMGEETTVELAEWLTKSSSMIMVCMLITIFIALILFILWNKIQKIEQAEAACLLEE